MKRFQVGKTYKVRSLLDHDCIFQLKVIDRTNKMVTLEGHSGIHRRKVRPNLANTAECCDPFGRYSMSPILDATDDATDGAE